MGIERLTPEIIFDKAEPQRAQGNYGGAIQVLDHPLRETIDSLSTAEEDTLVLQATEIIAASYLSLAQAQWTSPQVAHMLRKSKEVVLQTYRVPKLGEHAAKTKTDSRGNPYDFFNERARNTYRHMLILATLTGNSEVLENAINVMGTVIERATDSSIRNLVAFEKARLLHQTSPSQQRFEELEQAYNRSFSAAMESGGFERAAVVAARFIIDCNRYSKITSGSLAKENYHLVIDQYPEGHAILKKEWLKSTILPIRHHLWRLTLAPKNTYSEDLALDVI